MFNFFAVKVRKNGIGILLLIPYAVYIQSSSNILFSLFDR